MSGTWVENLVGVCTSNRNDVDDFDEDPFGWSRDLAWHDNGQFSMATVQANRAMEDYSQVETGIDAFFVGVYDGHGGIDASKYISKNLFHKLLHNLQENDSVMSENILRESISDTEEGFMAVVKEGYLLKPSLGRAGSCCLVGFIWSGTLYIANLGDSRAVLASVSAQPGILRIQQLTTDHNCNNERIRQDLWQMHPNDPHIVLKHRGSWRVKGIIQVSRTIGDAYLKKQRFTSNADFPKFEQVPGTFTRSVLSAEPEICSRVITNNDKFLIFASDGFWEHITNVKAAEIVCRFPRNGIAKRLIRTALAIALVKAARRRKISYKDLQGIDKGPHGRLAFHDDISVIVVYLDQRHGPIRRYVPEMSYRGSSDMVAASDFRHVISTTVHQTIV